MKKIFKVVVAIVVVGVVLPLAVLVLVPQPKPEVVTIGNYQTIKVNLAEMEYDGKSATMVEYASAGIYEYSGLVKTILGVPGGGSNSLAMLTGSEFTNGVIEVDIVGTLQEGAGKFARGFSGIAFRVADDLDSYETIYLRPANGRADDPVRRSHALQYASHPEFHFNVSRKESPGIYEAGADIGLDEWIHLKVVVQGAKAVVWVNGKQVMEVADMKLGAGRSGGVGLWVGSGTKAYFANLVVTPKE